MHTEMDVLVIEDYLFLKQEQQTLDPQKIPEYPQNIGLICLLMLRLLGRT